MRENNSENKKNKNKNFLLILLSLITLFLISFSTSAWIFIKSNNLVFVDSIEEYERKTKELSKKEAEINDLKESAERYKTLYETLKKKKTDIIVEEKAPVKEDKKENGNETDKKPHKEPEKVEGNVEKDPIPVTPVPEENDNNMGDINNYQPIEIE